MNKGSYSLVGRILDAFSVGFINGKAVDQLDFSTLENVKFLTGISREELSELIFDIPLSDSADICDDLAIAMIGCIELMDFNGLALELDFLVDQLELSRYSVDGVENAVSRAGLNSTIKLSREQGTAILAFFEYMVDRSEHDNCDFGICRQKVTECRNSWLTLFTPKTP